jgi:copper chaperone CopZ
MTTTITILGTHCASCKAVLEDVCKEVPGVTQCAVDFTTGETIIEHDESFDLEKLKREVALIGNYRVKETA